MPKIAQDLSLGSGSPTRQVPSGTTENNQDEILGTGRLAAKSFDEGNRRLRNYYRFSAACLSRAVNAAGSAVRLCMLMMAVLREKSQASPWTGALRLDFET